MRKFTQVATLLCAACLSIGVRAQDTTAAPSVGMPVPPAKPASMDQPLDVHAAIPLWPNGAPGAVGKADPDIPTVAVYLPAANPTHTAIVVAPGGGYAHLAMDHEGLQVAQWLNAHGVAAVVLKYRLGPTYHHPIELGDAQRAVRYVRSHAAQMGISPDHVGMLGFSAGGHLTASTGTMFDSGNPSAEDPIDRVSSRPDFLVLCYPVISMEQGVAHEGSVKYLLGDAPTAEQRSSMSADERVTAQTPPTFLWSTTDDAVVPVMNSVLFYQALLKNKVSAELHIFPHGRHGLGLAQTVPEVNAWPDLLYAWLRVNGWAL
ncbi:alpha/beta hydrolase [Terriglobus aquaticus]|uniref:Alpha/beta hydrolase n=1 Tax=Terriglobus aquaticus TaxID=940139 RepID=A0ABW9KLP7_9BACT|nr:alpha/beta hydrolase [Terriglobus aquaticus]